MTTCVCGPALTLPTQSMMMRASRRSIGRRPCLRGGGVLCQPFAEHDQRVHAGWLAYEAASNNTGVRYRACFHPGTQDRFNHDTMLRHDEAVAKRVWQRFIEFFNEHLRT